MESLEVAGNKNIFKDIKTNKKHILDIIECYEDSPIYFEYLKKFEDIEPLFYELANISYDFEIEEKTFFDCSHMIYCGITLGKKVTKYIEELFKCGEYSDAIILNAVCDDFLMQASCRLKDFLQKYCYDKKINVVKCYTPHKDIDAYYMENIVKKLKKLQLTLNKAYVVEPTKTLLFLISADETKCGDIRQSCDNCTPNCKWKSISR